MAIRITGYVLPSRLEKALDIWCKASGDDPSDVIADLVDAFLDDVAAETEELFPAEVPPPETDGRGQGGKRAEASPC